MNKLFLSIVVGGLISVGMISIALSEGNHKDEQGHDQGLADEHGASHMGGHWTSPVEVVARVNPIKSDQASLARGKQSYFQYCSSCHGATALGDGPNGAMLNPKPTNLASMAGIHPDGDFAWKIANGRGSMPEWRTVLKENQIWDLVNYIQALDKPNKKVVMKEMGHSNVGYSDNNDHVTEESGAPAKSKAHTH
jgi:mono/diheme cytochrome c family protein